MKCCAATIESNLSKRKLMKQHPSLFVIAQIPKRFPCRFESHSTHVSAKNVLTTSYVFGRKRYCLRAGPSTHEPHTCSNNVRFRILFDSIQHSLLRNQNTITFWEKLIDKWRAVLKINSRFTMIWMRVNWVVTVTWYRYCHTLMTMFVVGSRILQNIPHNDW